MMKSDKNFGGFYRVHAMHSGYIKNSSELYGTSYKFTGFDFEGGGALGGGDKI